MDTKRRGLMMVLSSPSGAGKSTLAKMLIDADAGIAMSVSATTRLPRDGEIDGKDYFFVNALKFESMVGEGAFLEHAKVFDHFYGTPKAPVEAALAEGRDVLFDIDWQGTQQIASKAPYDLVRVFVLPPSHAELERRLRARALDAPEVVERRMAKASDEISHWAEYDYVVINDDVNAAHAKIVAILHAERQRRTRQIGLHGFVEGLMALA